MQDERAMRSCVLVKPARSRWVASPEYYQEGSRGQDEEAVFE